MPAARFIGSFRTVSGVYGREPRSPPRYVLSWSLQLSFALYSPSGLLVRFSRKVLKYKHLQGYFLASMQVVYYARRIIGCARFSSLRPESLI
jgi:hypothetical protein